MSVVAVGSEEIVSFPQTGNRRHPRSLLPNIDMVVTPEALLIMKTDEGLFKIANEEHLAT
jgi:hypothetical protein